MSRRSVLSTAERVSLMALPDTDEELIGHYIFSELDHLLTKLRRVRRFGIGHLGLLL